MSLPRPQKYVDFYGCWAIILPTFGGLGTGLHYMSTSLFKARSMHRMVRWCGFRTRTQRVFRDFTGFLADRSRVCFRMYGIPYIANVTGSDMLCARCGCRTAIIDAISYLRKVLAYDTLVPILQLWKGLTSPTIVFLQRPDLHRFLAANPHRNRNPCLNITYSISPKAVYPDQPSTQTPTALCKPKVGTHFRFRRPPFIVLMVTALPYIFRCVALHKKVVSSIHG